MGVHENMCILGRPFSIRQMVGQGQNVVLLRGTNTMLDPQQKPYVDHFTGTDMHIEKFMVPHHYQRPNHWRLAISFRCQHLNAQLVFCNMLPPRTRTTGQVRCLTSERHADPDYSQASDTTRAAFRAMKFGVRIDWGVYAMLDYGSDASWPRSRQLGHPGLNNEQRKAYQVYGPFNPTNFNADAWMNLFPDQRHPRPSPSPPNLMNGFWNV